MTGRPPPEATSAPSEGPEWSARAAAWAQLWGGFASPAWHAVVEQTRLGAGTRVLDVGCGSGEFCQFAVEHGAAVSGLDAAEGMIAIARRRVPEADLRVGAIECLPWPDDHFELVTGFNAFQFAADIVAALAEAKRVTRPGGHVAICNWGAHEERDLAAIFTALAELQPPPPPTTPATKPPATGEPGVLEELARRAGLQPQSAGTIDVPYHASDQMTLQHALLQGAGFDSAIDQSGEDTVRETILNTTARYRQPDGSYHFDNRFRYLLAQA